MKLTYLGTAAAEGCPALFCNCPACRTAREIGGKNIRTRSQAIVNDDLLIDFCPDTYLHVLNYGLDLNPVKNVLVTHGHEDHLYMEDLACRQNYYTAFENRSPWVIGLYGSDWVVRLYHQNIRERGSGDLENVVAIHELTEFVPTEIGGYTVYPLLADHAPHEKCFIYAIVDSDGKSLLYAHDTGYLRSECWEFLKKQKLQFDLVSLDCTHGLGDNERNHMGMAAAGRVKERLLAEGYADSQTKFIVNHFSHNGLFLTHEDLESAAQKYGMAVAFDGLTVDTN